MEYLCLGVESSQIENANSADELVMCLPEPVASFMDVALKELKFSQYDEVN